MTIQLHQWFDISKRIGRYDREQVEAQMALYAYKDGLAANGPEWRASFVRQSVNTTASSQNEPHRTHPNRRPPLADPGARPRARPCPRRP